MNVEEYERAKIKLQEKHKTGLAEDMELLDRLYQMIKEEASESCSNGHVPRKPRTPRASGVGKGKVLSAVKEAFAKYPIKEFMAQELTDMLVSQGISTTRASVNGAIMRLVKKGFVEVTVQGIGRRPGKFKKAS